MEPATSSAEALTGVAARWLVSAVVLGLAGWFVIAVRFDEYACAAPGIGPDPGTSFAWAVAATATVLPLAYAVTRGTSRLRLVAVVVAAGSLLTWWLAMDPYGCQWNLP